MARIENFPVDRRDAVIAINLSSAFHATRLALPAHAGADGGKGWGRIINMASAHGLVASAEKSAYVAAKHGIVGLTKVTALENATTGVTCNAICPGWVLDASGAKTDGRQGRRRQHRQRGRHQTAAGRKEPSMQFTTPEELGALAVSSARLPATTCAAWPGTWTTAGRRSKRFRFSLYSILLT